jgi:hypothetical protein
MAPRGRFVSKRLVRPCCSMKSVPRIAITLAFGVGLVPGAQGESPTELPPLAPRLSVAGWFVEDSSAIPLRALVPFEPQYPLWSDSAAKKRWIELPPSTFINAADPNAWEFPPGTRFWKEFSLERRIETRLIERTSDGSWRYATYVWNEEGTDAELAPREGIAGLDIGNGGRYAIPSEYDCRACHEGGSVPILGFSALQLSPDRDPNAVHVDGTSQRTLDLVDLVKRGWLRNLPSKLLEHPPRIAARSAMERSALGYLHGNCGHCHVDPMAADAAVPVGVRLAQDVTDPNSGIEVLRSIVGMTSRFQPHGSAAPTRIVEPGKNSESVLVLRMRSRDPLVQMPPLGTQIVDSAGLALIERWIDQLEKEEALP